jgi:hypothetical protein
MKIENKKWKISLVLLLLSVSSCFGLRADINQDGQVNLLDLAILAEEWLMSNPLHIAAGQGVTPESVESTGLIEMSPTYYLYTPNGFGTYPNWMLEWKTIPLQRWVLTYRPEAGVSAMWTREDASLLGEYQANSGATGTITISLPVHVEAINRNFPREPIQQNRLQGRRSRLNPNR